MAQIEKKEQKEQEVSMQGAVMRELIARFTSENLKMESFERR